jgi:hypothetical protein
MKDKREIRGFSLRELTQIAEALNRSEAALQKRYKRLAKQAKQLLSAKEQQHPSRGTDQ